MKFNWIGSYIMFLIYFQYEASVIERLERSVDYSSVFNMVLLVKDTQFSGPMPGRVLYSSVFNMVLLVKDTQFSGSMPGRVLYS